MLFEASAKRALKLVALFGLYMQDEAAFKPSCQTFFGFSRNFGLTEEVHFY